MYPYKNKYAHINKLDEGGKREQAENLHQKAMKHLKITMTSLADTYRNNKHLDEWMGWLKIKKRKHLRKSLNHPSANTTGEFHRRRIQQTNDGGQSVNCHMWHATK